MAAVLMGVFLHGRHSVSLAQKTAKGNVSSTVHPILGTTRTGLPAYRPYPGGADFKDIYVQGLDVERTWSVRNPEPFLFAVTLSKLDLNSDRPVTVKMRPLMRDRGLGNGYA